MESDVEDGGYFAIKGFEYQIDKSILEILESTDENKFVNIEQIQDINSSDFVMQVKYRETQNFTPAKIKKPIIQLIDLYKQNNSVNYILYAYFGNLNGYDDFVSKNKKITSTKLDRILGNKHKLYDDDLKKSFVNNFYLDFSREFQHQFDLVISKIKELDFVGDSDEEAIFYYSNFANILRKIIVNNPSDQLHNRTLTKRGIITDLKEGNNLIFNSSFREYQGDEKYFKYINKKYFRNLNISDIERFIVFELSGKERQSELKDLIYLFREKFYKKTGPHTRKVIKSGAPYIFFTNINEEYLVNIKTELTNEGIVLKDGYDFYNANFSSDSIKTISTIFNNISIKIINNKIELYELIGSSFNKNKRIFQFYMKEELPIEPDITNIKIKINHISEIPSIL